MSLTTIAPIEKTENLIYVILPISIGLLLGSILSNDPTVWLTIASVTAPFLSILLYEMAWDEKRVKNEFNSYLDVIQDKSRTDFFRCNLFIRSWESTLQPFDGTDPIASDLSEFGSSVISSYVARRHFWRLRATFYIRLSLPLLFIVGFRVADSVLSTIALLFMELTLWILLLLVAWGSLCLLFDWLIQIAKKLRTAEVESFLNSYITYLYWHTMISSDTARTPDEYQSTSVKGIVKNELDALDRLLMRFDWDVFIQRWSRLNRNVRDLAEDDFVRYFQTRSFQLWGHYIFQNRMMKETNQVARQLQWLMYYATGTTLPVAEQDLLKLMQSASRPEVNGLLNPTLIFERLPATYLTDEGEESKPASVVAVGINTIFNNSSGSISQAVRKVIQELHTPQDIRVDRLRMADFVMQYIKERYQLGMDPFLNGYDKNQFYSIYSIVQNRMDKIYLLMDWFQKATTFQLERALEENLWSGILLESPVLRVVVNRLREFRGDYLEEDTMLTDFIQRLEEAGHDGEALELNHTLIEVQKRRES